MTIPHSHHVRIAALTSLLLAIGLLVSTPSASTSRLSRADPTIGVPQATASITVAEATGIA